MAPALFHIQRQLHNEIRGYDEAFDRWVKYKRMFKETVSDNNLIFQKKHLTYHRIRFTNLRDSG